MTKQTAEDLANARVSYEWADAADLAKYRALGEMLAALVAPQLDADVARAVAAELDARDTDDRANDDRDRDRSAEIADAAEAAVTEAMGRLTDWLSPEDITAVLDERAYAKIAKVLVDDAHLTVDVEVIYPEATLMAG
jgi:hypothetical protein